MHHLDRQARRIAQAHDLAAAGFSRAGSTLAERPRKRVQVGRRGGAQAERGKGVMVGAFDDHIVVPRQDAAQADQVGARRDMEAEIE